MIFREHYTVYLVHLSGQKARRYFYTTWAMYEFIKEWEDYLKEFRVYDTSFFLNPETDVITDYEPALVWKK